MIEFSEFKELPKHLVALQAEVENPEKSSSGHNYQYADLDTILKKVKPIMAKHGFSVVQSGYNDGELFGVETILLHDSGEYVRGKFGSPITNGPIKGCQAVGSQITYYRRYSLLSMLNIAPEDDDGEKASYGSAASNNKKDKVELATEGQKKKIWVLLKGTDKYNQNLDYINNVMTKNDASDWIKKMENKEGTK